MEISGRPPSSLLKNSRTPGCAPRARPMSGAGLRSRGQAATPEGEAKSAEAFCLRLLSREAERLGTTRTVSPGCHLTRERDAYRSLRGLKFRVGLLCE